MSNITNSAATKSASNATIQKGVPAVTGYQPQTRTKGNASSNAASAARVSASSNFAAGPAATKTTAAPTYVTTRSSKPQRW